MPVGTEVDARKGRVRLTAAATRGKAAHRAEFFGGMFVVTQAGDDVVDLKLSEPLGSCAKKTGARVRKLWGDGKGKLPHPRAVQRRHRPRHQMARPGHLRRPRSRASPKASSSVATSSSARRVLVTQGKTYTARAKRKPARTT